MSELTERELEILALSSGGLTTTQIANRLFIEHTVVRNYRHSIYKKLECSREHGYGHPSVASVVWYCRNYKIPSKLKRFRCLQKENNIPESILYLDPGLFYG